MSATVESITLTVEAAFGDAPLTATASNTWTDITAYVRDISWRRGRSHSLDSVQPGVCTFTLDNADRRFDPLHAAGPYYGDLKPNVKVRVSVTYSAVTYRMFTGYVNGWPQEYAQGNTDAECRVTAVDAFKLLGMHDLDDSMFTSWIASLRPTHWWRLDEPEGATAITNSGSSNVTGTALHPPEFGHEPLDAGSTATCLRSDGSDGGIGGDMRPYFVRIDEDVTGWTCAAFLVSVPNLTYGESADVLSDEGYVWNQPGDCIIKVEASATGGQLIVTDHAGGYEMESSAFYPVQRIGEQMRCIVVKRTGNSTGPDAWMDGVNISGTPYSPFPTATETDQYAYLAGYDFLGSTGRQTQGFGGSLQHFALFSTDISAYADDLYDAALDGHAGDATGTRLGRILDIAGWPAADRDLDTGVTVLAAARPNGASVLSYAQSLETTDHGLFFVAGDGDLTFIDREQLRSATRHTVSQTTFSDDGSDARYFSGSLSYANDDDQVRNESTVSGEGIHSQHHADATSVATYGRRAESITTLIADTRVARNLAEYRVLIRKDPVTRPDAFTVKPERDPAGIYPVTLDLDIGDRITVERTPQGVGSQIALACVVDSLAWSISPTGDISLTVSASPVADVDWFIIGTSLLDGTDVLAY